MMARTSLIVLILLTAAALPAQDTDRDGLSDELEMRLGMDPQQPDELVLICEDKSKADGDKTIGPKQDKAYDVTHIYFGSVAEDRYVWRLDFAQPPVLDKDIALILYLDADNDKATGRKDNEWAKGVDIMLRPGSLSAIEYDTKADPKPVTTYAIDGNRLYLVADLRLRQEEGKSVYRAYLLSQYMVKVDGRLDDSDRTEWIAVRGPGRSTRKRIDRIGVHAEGVVACMPRRAVLRNLERDPSNAVVPVEALELHGFTLDRKHRCIYGGEAIGSTASFPCPVSGQYRLGIVMGDDTDGAEDVTILVEGRKIARAVADQDDSGVYFFQTETPFDVKQGQKITLRAGQPVGYYRIHKVIFLKDLLTPDPLEISDVLADAPLPDEPTPTARITWITSLAASSVLEYEKQGGNPQTVVDEEPRNNHRVVLRDLEPNATYEFSVRARDKAGRETVSKTQSFSTKPVPLPPGTAARKSVALTIRNPHKFALTAWPVASGVPIPKGELTSAENVRLLDSAGKEVPCQVQLLGRWLDRSVKWVLVVFQANVPGEGAAQYTVEYGSEVKRQQFPTRLSVSETPNQVTLDTGALKLTLSKERGGLLGDVWLDRNKDGQYADDEKASGGDKPSVAHLQDRDGKLFTSLARPTRVVVEESGPLRASVRIEGDYTAEDGSTYYTYVARIEAYAGQPFVRVFYTFGNNSVGTMFSYVKELSLQLPLALNGERTCRMGIDEKEYAHRLAGPDSVRLFQNFDDKFSICENGKPAQEGKRAAGWAILGDERLGVLAAVKNFWQMYPKDYAATPEALRIGILPALGERDYDPFQPLHHRLYFHLLDGVYKLYRGVAKQHELFLDFHAAPDSAQALQRAAAFQSTIFPAASPQWYCDSKAFGDLVPAAPGEFEEYEAMVAKGFADLKVRQEKDKEYGWHNYGDWYGERRFNWGNIEYDTQGGLFMQFARSGNLDYFRHAVEAAEHNMDIDTIHYAARPGDVGKVHVHSLCHTGGYYSEKEFEGAIASGGYNRGHVWNRGLFWCHYLTGERRVGEVAGSVSECIARELTTNFTVGNHAERDTAWPLIGSMAAYGATGDRFFLNSAKIMVTDVLREQDPKAGNWQFPAGYSKVEPPPIGGYAWCCGLLIKALEMYYECAQDDRIKTCVARAAEWLVRDEWMPDRNGFRSTSCPTFNANTSAGGACWSCGPGLVTAYRMSGNKQFLDIGLKGYCYLIAKVSGMGKSYSQYICFSPNLIYDLKQLGITDVSTERYEPPFTAKAGGTPVILTGEKPTVCVTVTNNRKKGIKGHVAVIELPEGWKADAAKKEFAIATRNESATVSFVLDPSAELETGKEYRAKLRIECEGQAADFDFTIKVAAKASLGDKVGLIAGKDDFLGPALKKAGMQVEPIADAQSGLSAFRLIFVGTQAHTLDAAGVRSRPAALWEFVKSGGTLVLSQMNDDEWHPDLLPGQISLAEENSQSGKIVAPDSAVFHIKHPIADASGMEMFDTVAGLGAEWRVLLADQDGRPAIAEAGIGHGRMLLIEPSVERYYTGASKAADPARNGQYARLFENLLAYARRSADLPT